MPKKCPASHSSTSHKRQRSYREGQFPAGPYPKCAPPSCSPDVLSGINSSPTSTDASPFPCSCSKKRKLLRRPCSAANPTAHCPYYEKTSQLERSRFSGARDECCCGVPRKNKDNSKAEKRQEKVKPAKDSKVPKEPRPRKFRKERNPHKAIFEERTICEPEEEVDTLASDLRPCNCWESRVKPDREKSRNSCSKLLCCSCFKTLWKKKKKRKQGIAAPCKRYLCLHNPGRSELDEAIPCVQCTHNCNARYVEEGVKELPVGELPIVKPCPHSSSANSKPTKSITCEASGSERPGEAFKSNVIKNKEKCEASEMEDILERRPSPKEHKKNHTAKSTGENTRKSSKRKPGKDAKKRKKTAHGLPKSSTPTAGTSSMENRCCPCKIPETTEVKLKTKPCMKCPEKIMVGAKSSCKKLTFASCTDLRDYKLENKDKNTDTVKKRGAMGVVFDVIFWPYVFWPGRSDPCK